MWIYWEGGEVRIKTLCHWVPHPYVVFFFLRGYCFCLFVFTSSAVFGNVIQGIVHAGQAVCHWDTSPKRSDLYFGIPNTPLIRYTQRRARLQRMRPVRSYSHSLIQTNSHEGLSWAGYFYRVVSNDLGKIRKSEDSRKKIGFGLENCLDNRAMYLEGHYLRAIRSQEENQESIVSHWGDSGQD